MHIAFDNSYARLPSRFFARVAPSAAVTPRLIVFNADLAAQLGLDLQGADESDLARAFSGLVLIAGSEPLAMAYAGHQFGHFVPQLGDGRAILLGEIVGRDRVRYDVQLKGSGQTPFSRRGDGRAALGPVLREYLVSEAMAALGVPTTRSLAATLTGDAVYRETALPGGVLTRVARGHVRVGTFQFFAAQQDLDALRTLVVYVADRHYPEVSRSQTPALALLEAVVKAQAGLVAQWMSVGFIHGVMNTDNMAISGETIDYGPCAFMDVYHPNTVFSSIDEQGRYAYSNQPRVAQWNLTRFAETLLPLIDPDGARAVARATEALSAFGPAFDAAFARAFRAKLGLTTERPEDLALIQDLLAAMAQGEADFTLTFRALARGDAAQYFNDSALYLAWERAWVSRLADEGATREGRRTILLANNPWLVPRNHKVEAVIRSATAGDFAPFHVMSAALAHPFDERPEFAEFAIPPLPDERVERTFCGT